MAAARRIVATGLNFILMILVEKGEDASNIVLIFCLAVVMRMISMGYLLPFISLKPGDGPLSRLENFLGTSIQPFQYVGNHALHGVFFSF